MTLIEVMLSIVILGVIITPLTLSMYLGLQTATGSRQKTADSGGSQLLSAYFPTDVQSASTTRTSGFACSATAVVEFEWKDAQSGELNDVDYVVATSSGDDALLRKAYVDQPSACTPVSVDNLVPAIDPASPPVITCKPSTCATADVVSIDVTARAKKPGSDANIYNTYKYTLTGTRRADS